jgi:hypothetical protein
MDKPQHAHAPRLLDAETEHALKNHIAIIVGYCELLLADTSPEDSHHADILEMHRAAIAVLALLAAGGD